MSLFTVLGNTIVALGVSCLLVVRHLMLLLQGITSQHVLISLFLSGNVVDAASMAHVQKESSFLAANYTRDQPGAHPKTSGDPQEEET